MLAKVLSFGILGIDAYPITIEVDVANGLPAIHIVGLPDNAVKESKERVRAAIRNSGYKFKAHRITINLSPADTKKQGSTFDLAIAIGILLGSQQITTQHLDQFAILGELSLDGCVNPIKGSLPITLHNSKTLKKKLIIPYKNLEETCIDQDARIYPVKTMADVVEILKNPPAQSKIKIKSDHVFNESTKDNIDFNEVKGQFYAKRALEIAAAGRHNILLIGPPGSGKSMLIKRFPTILPRMTIDECLESTKIHSVAGLLDKTGIINKRPFRSPHHTTSAPAIVGGGSHPKPGEVTLAHNGVLFLDELPEFSRGVLESLRQPLEDHTVTIARANHTLRFPASFLLAASMNPCPCGYFTDPKRNCSCSDMHRQKYIGKISGPLLDRIDIHVEVPAISSHQMFDKNLGESSSMIRSRIEKAFLIQKKRFKGKQFHFNNYMSNTDISNFCVINDACRELLESVIEQYNLSARAFNKILKISRTIADLDSSEKVEEKHIIEAVQYRCLDRKWST